MIMTICNISSFFGQNTFLCCLWLNGSHICMYNQSMWAMFWNCPYIIRKAVNLPWSGTVLTLYEYFIHKAVNLPYSETVIIWKHYLWGTITTLRWSVLLPCTLFINNLVTNHHCDNSHLHRLWRHDTFVYLFTLHVVPSTWLLLTKHQQ